MRRGGTTDTLFWKPMYVPALKMFSLFEAVHYGAVRSSGVPRNFVRVEGGGGSTNSVKDRGQKTEIWER